MLFLAARLAAIVGVTGVTPNTDYKLACCRTLANDRVSKFADLSAELGC